MKRLLLLLLFLFSASCYAAPTKGIMLTWVVSASCTVGVGNGYNIYRATSSGAEAAPPINSIPIPCTATSYLDIAGGLTSGVTYYYEATTVEGGVEGSYSNETSTKFSSPAPVTGFSSTQN